MHADLPRPQSTTRDPKDDYLVALAHLAKADAIVSGDGDLHDAELTDLQVWTPRHIADLLAP
jgi:predicted nucleic acid-binding protein